MTRKKIAALLVLAGIAVTGGSAYTAGLTGVPTTKVIGQQTTTITGATANSVVYTYNAGKTQVTSIAVQLSGDTTGGGVHLWAIPNAAGSAGTPVDCGAGTFGTDTDYTCTVVTGSDWVVSGLGSVGFTLV